ncbi:hypothetical protein NDU88_008145 [Pleurodeles waltl]|uniref:Uncharacterized protein n=1 Tax=Pleurodeles waltl TaxID=8319 RepID=A0AAV7N6C6_PLEWA|nr:hypothetical protein NDU88_008145 [Pleurodeles waltl]
MKAKPERRRKRSSAQNGKNGVLRPAGKQTSEYALEIAVGTRAPSRRYGGMRGMTGMSRVHARVYNGRKTTVERRAACKTTDARLSIGTRRAFKQKHVANTNK